MMTAIRRPTMTLGLGTFGVLLATLFFWLSALGVPFAKGIYYVHTRENDVKYGNFGWCAGPSSSGIAKTTVCYQHVGYAFSPWIPGGVSATGALMFVALTAAFGTLALGALAYTLATLRAGIVALALTAFTTFLATMSFLLVTILFGTAHRRFNADTLNAHYGAGFVLVILGWLILLASTALVLLGWRGARRYASHTSTVVAH
ncbi:hypothetical protein IAU60_002895 [Kwoniella sp. DSM 27419]